jgi:hypothetical protein
MKQRASGKEPGRTPAGGTVCRRLGWALMLALSSAPATQSARAAVLEVGPGRPFARIEDAAAAARPGDVVLVHPREDGRPYERTAVFVRQPNVTFRGVPAEGSPRVKVSGKGFDYSGRGSTPRAIFQFNPGTDGCVLENFELSDARNGSYNGAGVRINQANDVTIRNCAIHGNDMGIMSGGDGTAARGVNQVIEHCEIYGNGNLDRAGYNHNLYLGGASVTLRFCEVRAAVCGHNVKSRAHHTRVEFSYIHHSTNREFDLVDARETALPGSHAVLLGNLIVKDPNCRGNKAVIHFGQDGGQEHDGTLYLAFNTIVTPFITPVVDLSAPKAKAELLGNLVYDGGVRQGGQQLAAARSGASLENVAGRYNWLSGGFAPIQASSLDPKTNLFRRVEGPLLVNPAEGDYRLRPEVAKAAFVPPGERKLALPAPPGAEDASGALPPAWQYRHPSGKAERTDRGQPVLGALGP